jgi:hypothetical protein
VLNTIVRGTIVRGAAILTVAVLAVRAAALTPVFSDDDFPIVGTYTKDEACKGDNARREDLLVKITRQNVESSMASCTILNRRRDGRAFQVHLECRMPGDLTIMGDATFIQRDDNALDFDDQDHTSPAVLHKCVGNTAAAAAESHGR